MEINFFIEEYNRYNPTINEFLDVNSDLNFENAQEIINEFVLKRIEQSKPKKSFNTVIEELMYSTNMSFISFGSISFYNEMILEENGLLKFAYYNESEPIFYSRENRKIYSKSFFSDEIVLCSENEDAFLRAVLLYSILYRNKQIRKISVSDENVDSIKRILGGEEYFELFQNLLKELNY